MEREERLRRFDMVSHRKRKRYVHLYYTRLKLYLRGWLDPKPLTALGECALFATWIYVLRSFALEEATLAINVTWYGAAFLFFGLIPGAAMDWVCL